MVIVFALFNVGDLGEEFAYYPYILLSLLLSVFMIGVSVFNGWRIVRAFKGNYFDSVRWFYFDRQSRAYLRC